MMSKTMAHNSRAMRRCLSITAAFIMLACSATTAHAQCADPIGAAGDVMFNTTYNIPQYCDANDNWIAMSGGNSSGPAFDSNAAMCTANAGGPYSLAGTVNTSHSASGVWSNNTHIFLADLGGGIDAYTFNGTNFTPAGTLTGYYSDIWSDDDFIYSIRNTNELVAFSYNGSSFTEEDSITLLYSPTYNLEGDGQYIFTTHGSDGIAAYTFDGTDLTLVNNYDTTSANDVCIQGDYAHVADNNNGLVALDFDGSSFSAAGSTGPTGDNARSIWCDDTYIFVGFFSDDRISAYTFNGSSYTLAGTLSGADTAGGLWYDGTYLYAGDDGNITAYVFDGSNFTLASTTPVPSGNPISQTWGDGQYIYVADGSAGLHAYSGFECLSTAPGGVDTSTQIVSDGLIGHWRLDETTGTTAYDSSGNGNDGTLEGANFTANSTRGVIKSSLNILRDSGDGADRVVIASGTNFPTGGGTNFSFTFWINPSDEPGTSYAFMYGDHTNDGTSGDTLGLVTSTGSWLLSSGGVIRGITDPNAHIIGRWTHITVTYDGTNIRFYNNAELLDTYPYSLSPSVPYLSFGTSDCTASCNSWVRAYAGKWDDVRFYDRALEPEEVMELYLARDGVRYNRAHRQPEYFDGNKWVSMTRQWPNVDEGPIYSSSAITGCSSAGETCDDGSIYAGLAPEDGTTPLYAMPTDAPGGADYSWNAGNASGASMVFVTADPCYGSGETGCQTGAQNTIDAIAEDSDTATGDVQLHVAAQYCADLEALGQIDWYLPAQEELEFLYNNRNTGDFSGTFSTTYPENTYWTSSEVNTSAVHIYTFDGSGGNNSTKENEWSVRCVRKGDGRVVAGTGGLVGHWKLDETSGTTAVNAVNPGTYDGTLNGSMDAEDDTTHGAVGTALAFDGIDDYISIPHNTIFDNGPFSVSLWYTTTIDTIDSGAHLFGKNTSNDSYSISRNGSGNQLTYRLDGTASPYRISDTTTLNDDGWQHVVLVYDGTSFGEIYTNGLKDDSDDTAHTGTLSTNTGALKIGGNPDTGTYWHGMIDDVRFYDRVLSLSEITQLYQMGTPAGASTDDPQGCPDPGDICDDGSVYAGTSSDDGSNIYFTRSLGVNIPWNNGNGSNQIETLIDDHDTGEANTNALVIADSDTTAGFQPHQAAQYCYDLNAHGADDWYLAAYDEIRSALSAVMTANPDIIEAGPYWTSSENSLGNAHSPLLNADGSTNAGSYPKERTNRLTRCVRKGAAPRCANPYGMEGSMMYNTDHDVMQFCDGARWRAIGKYGP